MIIDILNISKFIKDNNCGEVDTVQYFEPNSSVPKSSGLVSYEIFGIPGTEERKEKFGFIKLNGTFMNPHVLYVLKRLKAKMAEDMIRGTNRYFVNNKRELEKIPDNRTAPKYAKNIGVGMDWLKSVWETIDWKPKKTDSRGATERKLFLDSLTLDEVFIDKYIVIPAFYRDMDISKSKKNEINVNFYEKMISLADMVKNTDPIYSDDFSLPSNSVAYINLQNVIYDCYLYFIDKIGGLNGFIHDRVMGKATTYGARLVISAPDFNKESVDDLDIDFHNTSLPLSIAVNIFSPFIIHGLVRFVENYVSGNREIYIPNPQTKKLEKRELSQTFMEQFTTDKIKRMLKLYEKSKVFRIEPFTLDDKDGNKIPLCYLGVVPTTNNKDTKEYNVTSAANLDDNMFNDDRVIIRPLTYTDVLYLVAYKHLKDKHIYNTRYPVIDINGTYASRFNIVPCDKHFKVYINGELYPRFPNLDGATVHNADYIFDDSLKLFTTYLGGLGGDYDGDHITVQSTFSNEANADAEKQMKGLSNIIGVNGSVSRKLGNVCYHGLYGLTIRAKKET